MTGAAVAGLLDEGIDVTLHSSSGRWRGTLSSAASGNVYLLLAQVDAWQRPERRVEIVRALIAGKIAGQRQVVRRAWLDRSRVRCEAAARRLGELEAQCWGEEDLDALRGVEGLASAEYFGVFDELLSDGWRWPGRVRRPPTDPVNAMLSFGYTLACGEVGRALTLRGFDTRIGLLHGLRYGRESLVLDVVEEFRAAMVDRFVLKRINLGQVKVEDFETHDDGAVRLRDGARRDFLEAWETMLDERPPKLLNEREEAGRAVVVSERVTRPAKAGDAEEKEGEEDDEGAEKETGKEGAPTTWRTRIERQVGRLWGVLMKGEPYVPMTLTRKAVGQRWRTVGQKRPRGTGAEAGEGGSEGGGSDEGGGGRQVVRQRPPKR